MYYVYNNYCFFRTSVYNIILLRRRGSHPDGACLNYTYHVFASENSMKSSVVVSMMSPFSSILITHVSMKKGLGPHINIPFNHVGVLE